VKAVKSTEEYKQILKTAADENKLVIVDFYAVWCGPCKYISPIFADYSEKYTNAVFVRVDVDELEEVSLEANISCMPTFQFYLGGAKVDELEGADKIELANLIEKHIK